MARTASAETADRKLVAFVSPSYEDVALNELRDLTSARLVRALARGVLLMSLPHGPGETAERLIARPPIFVRQVLLDVSVVASTNDSESDALAIAERCNAARAREATLCDLAGRSHSGHDALEAKVASMLDGGASDNRCLVIAMPGQYVIGTILAGAGTPGAPTWPGGRPLMSIDQQFVSRSAFKLMEAIDLFSIRIDPQARALDLGAAPGGWSQVLASYGAQVTAVDPGELDPRVACLPNVHVFSGTAQAFMRAGSEQFDLIVDDMRLDARESARLLVAAQVVLRPSAAALITLKLPERAPSAVLGRALTTLRAGYLILGARCLYFNRNEVTVHARRRT